MVRALLDGRKTQTRRVMKPQPPTVIDRDGDEGPGPEGWGASSEYECIRSPYGVPGDRLWVRETFMHSFAGENTSACCYLADAGTGRWLQATSEEHAKSSWKGMWKPSIFMPRWASRITLEITEVRVQRLQEISAEDAIAEGIKRELSCDGENYGWLPAHDGDFELSNFPRNAFAAAWMHINGAESWDANPWVWAISFQVVGA